MLDITGRLNYRLQRPLQERFVKDARSKAARPALSHRICLKDTIGAMLAAEFSGTIGMSFCWEAYCLIVPSPLDGLDFGV